MPRKEGKEHLPIINFFLEEEEVLGRESPPELDPSPDVKKRNLELENEELDLEKKRIAIEQRQKMLTLLAYIFFLAMVFTAALFILHGFGIAGFSLSETTLNILAGAFLVEAAGLLAIALRGIYDK